MGKNVKEEIVKIKISCTFKIVVLFIAFSDIAFSNNPNSACIVENTAKIFWIYYNYSISDTIKKPEIKYWTTDLTARLNLTQIGFQNWKSGGENSFAWVSMIDGKYIYRDSLIDWRTTQRFSYGQTKQGERSFRKNEDMIDISSVFSYLIGWNVDPYFSITVRTQFTKGYNYSNDLAVPISDIFDPAYSTQNLGFQYIPSKQKAIFSIRAGLSLKETFTRNFNSYTDDPKTGEIEKTKIQLGSELVCEFQKSFNSTFSLKSKFDLFTDYKRIDGTDLRWDNLMTIQLMKYIAVSLNAIMYYNKDESRQFQWKEVLGVGLFYDFR